MIASWMLYAFLVSALVTVAALALDRVADARRWPLRAVWIGALLLSVAWPMGSVARHFVLTSMAPVRLLPFTITVEPASIITSGSVTPNRAALVDRSLIVLWCAFSALLLLRLSQGVLILRRTRGSWKACDVDGTAVRVSANVGPAVVGLRSMDVVLPEWILALDAPLRAIVLRHEEEHRTARDPYALFAAAVAVALMPWNVALWIQARRLRLAIELDCDVRVLRAHPSPERYGLLMLTIAQRRSVAPTLFAPMLTETTTQLERRILAMRNTTRRLARVTAYGGTAVAIGVLIFACSLQAADATFAAPITKRLLPTLAVPAPIAALPSMAATGVSPARRKAETESAAAAVQPRRQDANPAPRYPELLMRAEIEGSVVVEFSTDGNGTPDMDTFRVLSSSHDLFTAAVKNVLPQWHLAPNASAHIPFVFNIVARPGERSTRAAHIVVDGIDAVVITGVRLPPDAGAGQPTNGLGQVRLENGVRAVNPNGPTPVNDHQTYFEFQVENQVSPVPGNPGARYPDSLRTAHVEGEVLAQFVVDTLGHPLMDTFKVLKSTHVMFTDAVRASLPNMRFNPALVGGRPVKQLVQMPFQFNLSK